jgi:hypothetical protein
MKLTNKQKQEIKFFEDWGINGKPFESTPEEREEYINETVNGIKVERKSVWDKMNKISQAKRMFEITYKMWKEDIDVGMLSPDELMEDFSDNSFGVKIVESLAPNYMKFKNKDNPYAENMYRYFLGEYLESLYRNNQ